MNGSGMMTTDRTYAQQASGPMQQDESLTTDLNRAANRLSSLAYDVGRLRGRLMGEEPATEAKGVNGGVPSATPAAGHSAQSIHSLISEIDQTVSRITAFVG